MLSSWHPMPSGTRELHQLGVRAARAGVSCLVMYITSMRPLKIAWASGSASSTEPSRHNTRPLSAARTMPATITTGTTVSMRSCAGSRSRHRSQATEVGLKHRKKRTRSILVREPGTHHHKSRHDSVGRLPVWDGVRVQHWQRHVEHDRRTRSIVRLTGETRAGPVCCPPQSTGWFRCWSAKRRARAWCQRYIGEDRHVPETDGARRLNELDRDLVPPSRGSSAPEVTLCVAPVERRQEPLGSAVLRRLVARQTPYGLSSRPSFRSARGRTRTSPCS
jgi:hypothetical protein